MQVYYSLIHLIRLAWRIRYIALRNLYQIGCWMKFLFLDVCWRSQSKVCWSYDNRTHFAVLRAHGEAQSSAYDWYSCTIFKISYYLFNNTQKSHNKLRNHPLFRYLSHNHSTKRGPMQKEISRNTANKQCCSTLHPDWYSTAVRHHFRGLCLKPSATESWSIWIERQDFELAYAYWTNNSDAYHMMKRVVSYRTEWSHPCWHHTQQNHRNFLGQYN